MRQSLLFTKTSKTAPKDEVSKNAALLIRAGFVHKEMAGVYSYLPLGLRVIEKIKAIIREEMNKVGGQEIIMTALQDPEIWKKTNRWDDAVVDVWFKSKLKNNVEVGFGWSHEEPIVEMMQRYATSYKDFPISVYQFQTKLRNELRAKSGIMRGREFVMKDMYSLHATQEDCDAYYEGVIEAYKRCFQRFGIGESTFLTFASGGSFTKFSHEFQTLCEAGEDILYTNADQSVAVNEEVLVEAAQELGIEKSDLQPVKSAEVGNIFKFGTEKSEQMGVYFTDREGKRQPIYLASYGIGVTRVMGVVVEKLADEVGLVWPDALAPFQVHLIALGDFTEAEKIYVQLQAVGIEVLYDDRDARAGEKFADSDLIGIPHRLVVGKSFAESGKIEYKARTENEAQELTFEQLLTLLKIKG
jgi:prolyl-tRNA synthetase